MNYSVEMGQKQAGDEVHARVGSREGERQGSEDVVVEDHSAGRHPSCEKEGPSVGSCQGCHMEGPQWAEAKLALMMD